MNKQQAQELALSLMGEHGLTDAGWTLVFHDSAKVLGRCLHKEKYLSLSNQYVAAVGADDVKQTMLHEIAHALLPSRRKNGKAYGHGPEWQRLAKKLGGSDQRHGANPFTEKSPAPVGLDTPIDEGDTVWVPFASDGMTGVVTRVGRTKFDFVVETGRTWTGYIHRAVKVAEREDSPVLAAA
jgi:hypothetical protein